MHSMKRHAHLSDVTKKNMTFAHYGILTNLTEFHPRYNNEQTNLLVFTLEGHTCKSTIKLKTADEKNLQLLFDSTTKLARTGSAWGIESGVLNR